MKSMLCVGFFAAVLIGAASAAEPTVLSFDDITTDTGIARPIEDGYGGLNWQGVNLSDRAHGGHVAHGIHSGDYAAYTAADLTGEVTTPSGTFDLISAYLTAMWLNNVKLTVRGYLDGELLYETTVTVPYSQPTKFVFNFTGIDRLQWISDPGPGQNLDVLVDDMEVVLPAPCDTSDLEQQIATLEGLVTDLVAQNALLLDQVGALTSENESLLYAIDQLNAIIEQQQQEIEDLNQTLASMYTPEEVVEAIEQSCPGNAEFPGRPDSPGNSNPKGPQK